MAGIQPICFLVACQGMTCVMAVVVVCRLRYLLIAIIIDAAEFIAADGRSSIGTVGLRHFCPVPARSSTCRQRIIAPAES